MSDIYITPEPDDADLIVIEEIGRLRRDLYHYVAHRPRRWLGHLRRMSFARAVRGSNWIEGYRASLDDVLDAIEDEEPTDTAEETRLALTGYRDAMTYVLGLAEDRVTVDESLLKSLHFMMTKHELRVRPGRYRAGDVWVEDEAGTRVYQAPDAELVDRLMGSLVESLNRNDSVPVMLRAAMAHLNLVMIHPFRDGNGRMARALQTLVLSAEGIVSPVFSSVEEYLGRNTNDYYAILSEVGQGSWRPHNSARPWTRFMLRAHYRQAWTLKRRVHEIEQLYDALSQVIASRGVPQRSIGALADAARGRRLQRSLYAKLVEIADGEPISDLSASRDLRTLTDAGLLDAAGAGRGRTYHGSRDLRDLWADIRSSRPPRADNDPYETLAQRRLPGMGEGGT
ncbi:MAG: Fic family protein [Acidimicrobiaceae bacterium]|nr:Fic family protein [Acidimicrobiaceae bacterium]MDE0657127.1 Fic family protein [Acidimicrobiaceae bacterium]